MKAFAISSLRHSIGMLRVTFIYKNLFIPCKNPTFNTLRAACEQMGRVLGVVSRLNLMLRVKKCNTKLNLNQLQ